MQSQTSHILVLGAGYAGVLAALRVAGKTKRLNRTVTLVTPLPHFVKRPRLHEEATGIPVKKRLLSQMLRGSDVGFVQGWAMVIDTQRQTVLIKNDDSEQALPYTHLVVAMGSQVERQQIPGVDEHVYTLDPYGRLTTAALRTKFTTFDGQPFRAVVVGGDATGVETVTQFRGFYPEA